MLKLCRCHTACFMCAHCGDNTCSPAGQVRHTCITPYATTPAGQATETCESSGNHHTCRPCYKHLSVIQWPSNLQAKLKNTCVSSGGHQTCRPRYRHLWILQWPPHLQALAQRWSHARIAAVRVMLCTWALHPHLKTQHFSISWHLIRLPLYINNL